jgi:hypothetical protein
VYLNTVAIELDFVKPLLTLRRLWHYTPKHGSWLDLAESGLGVLSSQCLDLINIQCSHQAQAPLPLNLNESGD